MATVDQLIGNETITHGLIAHATSNEYRLSSGGEIGDQCGHELCACTWFDAGWTAVYVAMNKKENEGEEASEDEEALERMARFAEDAVTNGYFGYSQNKKFRINFIDLMEKNGFQPDLININRVIDCSGLIYGAVLAAGYDKYGEIYSKYETEILSETGEEILRIPNTKGDAEEGVPSIADYLEELGFKKYENDEYLRGYKNLKRGYILYRSGHIAIWI
jgi:hypothetical protein